MKSILFLSVMNGSAWGGSEEQWFRLALWMAKKKYDVAVSCFDWPEKAERLNALQNEGIKLFLLPKNNKGIIARWRLQKQVNKIPFEKYDLVFINQGGVKDISHSPFKTIYKRCRKYVTSSHNYYEKGSLSYFKKSLLAKWFSNASLNIGDSQKIFDALQNKFNIHPANNKVVYNPIGFPYPEKINPFSTANNNSVIFTMLAALDVVRKAQDVLINALSNDKWKSRNWYLYLYGEGDDFEILNSLIKHNKIDDKIFLKGHTDNVVSALNQSHLNLQITHIDAMPISVVEAMALSRPCIVSKVGDMPIWVQHEQNGYISSAITVEAIDEVLELAWHQKDKWSEMGEKSFAKFQELYPHPYEENFVALLESL